MADNNIPAPRKNGPGRPFVKGQPSPNPGGRPKKLVEFQRALTERYYEKALDVLGECLDDEDGKVRMAALRETFDRMFGKASQPITGADGQPLVPAGDLALALSRLLKK